MNNEQGKRMTAQRGDAVQRRGKIEKAKITGRG